ncbi:MAG: methylenetetrahydrofolate--tRNA-(uracil(54)-C(5))-methyltransferase (FADH(2)-oxidizing) TrmFO [Bdellovibrionota bacterium]
MNTKKIHVVGAGLAGTECALQLAQMGYQVELYEMRGVKSTPAHKTQDFAELVCSNSFGSMGAASAPGQLKWEAEKLGSHILTAAKEAAVPAGQALGVDREVFARILTEKVRSNPLITVNNKVINKLSDVPRPAVIATGPLTDESLAEDLRSHFGGNDFLYFYDAIAPIIDADSINYDVVWRADRYDKGTADYLNCPIEKEHYYTLITEIENARKIELKEFETTKYFEGCMPIEEMVRRGPETLRFGPLKPVGLRNPKTGRDAWAVVQLRQDNKEGTAFNMVGFQTRMAYGEQTRVFRMIPGLENAEFLKLGSIHRNLYINSPEKLSCDLSSKQDPWLFFAGQITGVEGYFESTCVGLMVAKFLDQKLKDKPFSAPPRASAFGSILEAITEPSRAKHFQPTNINLGLFPAVTKEEEDQIYTRNARGRLIFDKNRKKEYQLQKAQNALSEWI